MADKYLNLSGVQRLWNKIKTYIDNIVSEKINKTDEATDVKYGLVKLNLDEDITLNGSGRLDIGGRLGQMPDTTGMYAPRTISPKTVGSGSLLLTEGSGTTLGAKSLSVTTGMMLSLSPTAAPGATTYSVSNTYENRIKAFLAIGGVVALNEASASTTSRVLSVQINGVDVVPRSDGSDDKIIITVENSINPNSSTSNIRIYPNQDGFSNLLVGQGVRSAVGYGASLTVGQSVYSGKNACCSVGASLYNNGNGSALFGRQHINVKNRAFLAGTGHDTTNAPSENVSAFGAWSSLSYDTLFAVGFGTSNTERKNAFEILTDGSFVLRSPRGKRFKFTVDENGTLSGTAL